MALMKKTSDKHEFKCPFPCSCTWRQAGNPKCAAGKPMVTCSEYMNREEMEAAKKSGDSVKLIPKRGKNA